MAARSISRKSSPIRLSARPRRAAVLYDGNRIVSGQEANRDRAVDALLRGQMGPRAAGEPSDQCLDADTLAAWIDGDLKGADVAAAEAHVSSCARCQSMIAALVRATPAAARTVPWWRRGWVIGSLVPLTAGAMAIAIWIATPGVTRAPQPMRADTRVQQQAGVPPGERAAASGPAPAVEAEKRVAIAPQQPAALADRNSAVNRLEAPEAADARARDAAAQKEIAAPLAARAEPAAPPPAAAPTAPPPAAAPTAANASSQGAGVSAAAAAPLPPIAAPEAARQAFGARNAIVSDQALARHSVTPVVVASPNPSIRWRIGAAGSIERSGNGGTTWSAASSGVTEDLTAGAAPSPVVCWIVGRRGTVLLSIDGLQWRRLAFPDTVDLAAVQAADASNATVTAADNRRFRTADGGQTWTSLQEF